MKSKYYLKIKEIINLIYELTKDGYQGEFKSMGRTTGAIATFLKKKNILKSESCSNGKIGVSYYYKWNETVPQPSDVFIRQIQDEYYELNRERKRKWVREKENPSTEMKPTDKHYTFHPKNNKPESENKTEKTKTIPVPRNIPEGNRILRNEEILAKITDTEIWNELKKRGWAILAEKLVKQEIME